MGCTGENNIPRIQRKMPGEEADYLRDPEYHLSGMAVLHQTVVDPALYLERMGIRKFIRGYNPWTKRTGGI